jgi:hypothetical protein
MRHQNLEAYTTVAQYLLFFLLVWMLFRIQVFYALIISFVAFFGYGLVQVMIVMGGTALHWLSLGHIADKYVIEVATASIYTLIAWTIKKKRIGFNFVPTSMHARVKYSKLNIAFLVVIMLAMMALTIVLFTTLGFSSYIDGIYFAVLFGVSVFLVLRLSYVKEWEDIDD